MEMEQGRPEGWTLWRRVEFDPACPWINVQLVRPEPKRARVKQRWYLAWNGERFADSVEVKNLAQDYPAVLAWVRSVLEVSHD